jgi:hypothetical protein
MRQAHLFFPLLEDFLYAACFVLPSALAVAFLHCPAFGEAHSHQTYVCFCTLTKATGLIEQKEFFGSVNVPAWPGHCALINFS